MKLRKTCLGQFYSECERFSVTFPVHPRQHLLATAGADFRYFKIADTDIQDRKAIASAVRWVEKQMALASNA